MPLKPCCATRRNSGTVMTGTRKNILVIKLGALGDFIQALGPMKAIRAHHSAPDFAITLLTTKPFAELARRSGYFDDIWLDTRPKWYDFSGWLHLRKKLNAGQFERVYDLQNNDRTGFYLKLMSPKPEWVGAAKGASHRNSSPERTAGQAFDGHVQTLALAGVHGVQIDSLEWIESDLDRLGLQKPYALIVPGSAANHPEKRWPADRYATLCTKLSEAGFQPVLLGTKEEQGVTSLIAHSCPACLDLTGQTSLLDIAALARGAAMAVGNDTGPMHMIAPTGCPSLVLFSKNSNPVRHAPKGPDTKTLQVADLATLDVEQVLNLLPLPVQIKN